MPLPNGVNPFGVIRPVCPSASLLGNSGILHGDDGKIFRRWQHNQWKACALHFKGRKFDSFIKPGEYTVLFFLDEATAFAAGHRPCGECRKKDYRRFKDAWEAAKGLEVPIRDVDRQLHRERVQSSPDKKLPELRVDELPDGAMFSFGDSAFLKWHRQTFAWSDRGYLPSSEDFSGSMVVPVLTPMLIREVLRRGYPVQVHQSVLDLVSC
jgi:hypothetical protein